ncbi:hypothetical protein JD969_15480 [Planctomycetota bacterium]|nr:hypothetical protein JD969_15480 [Planctomycetota bacterium]
MSENDNLPYDNSDEQNPSPRTPKLPANAPVEHGFVSSDFPCYQCAYNLRTAHVENNCPECGYSIIKSIVLGSSFYNHIPWLKTISTGLLLMIIAVCITIGLYLISFIPALLIQYANTTPTTFSSSIPCLSLPATIAVYILLLIGVIFYTTKKKSTPEQIANLPSRKYLRFFYIFWTIATIAVIFLMIVPSIFIPIYFATTSSSPSTTAIYGLITIFVIIVASFIFCMSVFPCIVLTCFLRYTSHIAKYFDRPKVSLTCNIIFYITLALFTIASLIFLFTIASLTVDFVAVDFVADPQYFLDTLPNSISSVSTLFIAAAFIAFAALNLYILALFITLFIIIILLRISIKGRINTNSPST